MDTDLPLVGQPLAPSPHGWTRAAYRREGSSWVTEYGFAAEDWNFAAHQAVDGVIYGYGQGSLRPVRVGTSDARMNVLFYFRDAEGQFRAAGLYLGARYLDPRAANMAWERLRAAGVLEQRLAELQQFKDGGAAARIYRNSQALRWACPVEGVRVFPQLPVFAPRRPTDWRHGNAYDYSQWRGLPALLSQAQPLLPLRPRITALVVDGFRSFYESQRLELAPLTFIIGKNNAGKSALLRAPRLLTRALRRDATVPFELDDDGLDHGRSLLGLCYERQLSGLALGLELADPSSVRGVTLGATAVPESGFLQRVTQLQITPVTGTPLNLRRVMPWGEAQRHLASYPDLYALGDSVLVLGGLRRSPGRSVRWGGQRPSRVGAQGQHTPALLADAEVRNDRAWWTRLNTWFERALGATLSLRVEEGQVEVLASSPRRTERVSLMDSGHGLAQALPVAVALMPPIEDPDLRLLCIEQPELHLHPAAHPEVAELLIARSLEPSAPGLLVETHSDALTLRVRAAVAEGRLPAEHVQILYVDEQPPGKRGSQVRSIRLDDRGTPDWWPEGVFAEPHLEFKRIRRALLRRDGAP